jgi:hypothetical protein
MGVNCNFYSLNLIIISTNDVLFIFSLHATLFYLNKKTVCFTTCYVVKHTVFIFKKVLHVD